MTELPKLNSVAKCKKCAESFEVVRPDKEYTIGGALVDNQLHTLLSNVDEAIVRTCPYCGYKWLEECVESE